MFRFMVLVFVICALVLSVIFLGIAEKKPTLRRFGTALLWFWIAFSIIVFATFQKIVRFFGF